MLAVLLGHCCSCRSYALLLAVRVLCGCNVCLKGERKRFPRNDLGLL